MRKRKSAVKYVAIWIRHDNGSHECVAAVDTVDRAFQLSAMDSGGAREAALPVEILSFQEAVPFP